MQQSEHGLPRIPVPAPTEFADVNNNCKFALARAFDYPDCKRTGPAALAADLK